MFYEELCGLAVRVGVVVSDNPTEEILRARILGVLACE